MLSKNVPGAHRMVSSVEWGPQYEQQHGVSQSYLDSLRCWCPLN